MKAAVIIPAYNTAAYLGEAVESARRQTVPPADIIVINDGSTDATRDVLEYLAQAGDLNAVHQSNAGVSAARNRGASLVGTADWLLFLDADDRLLPTALEIFQQTQTRFPQARILYGQARCFHEDNSAEPWLHGDARSVGPIPAAARASFWKSALTTPGVALIRRDLFREIGGFDPRYCPTEDRDFWIKAGTVAEFAYASVPVLERRLHAHNASHQRGRLRIQGARAQLDFPAWQTARGADPALLGISDLQIIEQNLERALAYREFDAVAWLCGEAARRQLETPSLRGARALLDRPQWLRRLTLYLTEYLRRYRAAYFPPKSVGQPIAPRHTMRTALFDDTSWP